MSFFGKIFEWFENAVDRDDHLEVTVKKGDSLWKIAEETTGDGANWQKIADANPDKHWTRDYVIQPGEVLRLPKT
jgi:nucleoid-associated protein YgaU